MSKFNIEAAFSDLSKKVTSLATKISTQSAMMEAQSKKIDEQEQTINSCYSTINDQKRVITDLYTKIEEVVTLLSAMNASQKEKKHPDEKPVTQSANETTSIAEATSMQNNNLSQRARRAAARSKTKAASIPHSGNEAVSIDAETEILKNINEEMEEWKVVSNKRKSKRLSLHTIKTGGNADISAFQAIQKKKFLHVWSLHPDTSIDAISKHITEICGTKDVKIEKIVPKTKRDYASFMIGVPEPLYEKINNADIWPLNTQFNEWVWFRSSRK